MNEYGYIIAETATGQYKAKYSPAASPVTHQNFECAHREAIRLAEANPGVSFTVFQPVSVTRAPVPPKPEAETRVMGLIRT